MTYDEMGEQGNRSRKRLGVWGEGYAVRLLEDKGYEIVARNWRWGRKGEVDIVARDGEVLVFVEVRTRRGKRAGTPAESLTVRKQQKLYQLVQAYLMTHELGEVACRLDLVGIEVDERGRLIRCNHFENVLQT
ncbi:MAG TPA: YraN family protein [Anaerolineae bacterium]|nr:YraN family protein [Anaerolineae bacterium]